jgi:hypothetical protein
MQVVPVGTHPMMLEGLLVLGLAIVPLMPTADGVTVRATTTLTPDGVVRNAPVQVTVTLDASAPVVGATLVVVAPLGVTLRTADGAGTRTSVRQTVGASADVVTIALPEFDRRLVRTFTMQAAGAGDVRGAYRVMVEVTGKDGAGRNVLLAQDAVAVTLAPTVPVERYLLLGIVGILFGFGVRLVMKARDSIPVAQQPLPAPPAFPAAPAAQAAPVNDGTTLGPIGTWLASKPAHFYSVDCLVTLVLGFGALLALLSAGHVPDTAAQWYGALLLGFALGLLTNSELVTRLPTR